MAKLKPAKAFTLLELVIVIIIIGVLATLALPKLSNMIEGSRISEAVSIIGHIRAGLERCYLMHDGTYVNCSASSSSDEDWEMLGMGNPAKTPGSHFRYGVSAGSDFYLICASREGAVDPVGMATTCYEVCLGLGVQSSFMAGPFGCSALVGKTGDDKLYWGADSQHRVFLPKNN